MTFQLLEEIRKRFDPPEDEATGEVDPWEDPRASLWWLEEHDGEIRKPSVYKVLLPPPDEAEHIHPWILIRPADAEDGEEKGSENVDIVVGTYAEDRDGWQDCVFVVEAIRENLGRCPVVGGRFRCEKPINTTYFFEEAQQPHWQILIQTTWTTTRIPRAREI
jgi:hypothetical protein